MCGSNRSVAISQKPGSKHRTEPRDLQIHRLRGQARRPRREGTRAEEQERALTTKAAGTNVPGAIVRRPRDPAMTSRMETTAVATTIIGSVVTSRCAR